MQTADQGAGIQGWLAGAIEDHSGDLVQRYRQSLLSHLFTNRVQMRPALISQVATGEVDALLRYFRSDLLSGEAHGAELCQKGLSEVSLLGLAHETRQFTLGHLQSVQVAEGLNAVDAFHDQVMVGYIRERTRVTLAEQEDLRRALQKAVSHYTVEIREVRAVAEQAAEVSEFKNRLIGQISHELRTPLGAIIGMTEMLMKDMASQITPRQERMIRRILTNAQTLSMMFSELLDQSLIESGQFKLREETISVRDLGETAHTDHLPAAILKGLSLHLQIDPGLPYQILGDRVRLLEVIGNLVVNAIKYTRKGSVWIAMRREPPAEWVIEITDTGIGIPKESLDIIFEPFRRVENNSGMQAGVGLGLSIVNHLVQKMQGRIIVTSEVSRGSCFKVILPLRQAAEKGSDETME